MKYEDMSNFEISKRIAEIKFNATEVVELSWGKDKSGAIWTDQNLGLQGFDLSNPLQLMPIAIEYGFSIEIPDDNLCSVGSITKYIEGNTDIQVDYSDKNETYRAIAICFLKMKDAEVK